MRGLLSKLAGIDTSAERGIRVIEFFDQLVAHRADVEAVVRATAVLAETTAGAIFDEFADIVAVAPDGRTLSAAGPGPHALVNEIVVDDNTVGRVWLERADAGDGHEWDELIIARMSLALATFHSRRYSEGEGRLGLTDPAIVHVLLRETSTETETARAGRLLGFPVGQIVRVIAVTAGEHVEAALPELRAAVAAATRGRAIAAAMSSNLAVVVVSGEHPVRPPLAPGISACVGPAVEVENCARSWAQARRGVRFAAARGSRPHWADTDELGSVIALVDLNPEDVVKLADVKAIAKLAAAKSDDIDLQVLDEMGWLFSSREVAAALHMHHSSIAYRIDGICRVLGFDIRTAEGRYRARTALLLWQLHVRKTGQAIEW
ncbi:MAG: hypothetical protein QOJ11_2171 [Frankiales bacterium]|jgi:hypothetical protein|nr:hypothetical protein [Frankiales bacterium]